MLHQPQGRRVFALTLLLALTLLFAVVTEGGLGRGQVAGPYGGQPVVAWWFLAPAFALVEVMGLWLRRCRSWVPPVAGAVPLVVGLLLAAPVDVLAARVLAVSVVGVVWRGRSARRLGLGAMMVAANVVTAQVTFIALIAGAGLVGSWQRGVAALLAGGVAALLDASVVIVVVSWYGNSPFGLPAVRTFLAWIAGALLAGAVGVGLAVVVPIGLTTGHGALISVAMASALAVQRAGQSLAVQRRSLERLRELSDVLVAEPASSDVVGVLLAQSLELIGVRYAETVIDTPDGAAARDGGRAGRWTLRAGQEPLGPGPTVSPGAEILPGFTDLLADSTPGHLVITHDTLAERAFLDARGLTEAMLVPLRSGKQQPIGHLLVGDRIAQGLPPTDNEGRLLQIVANHASVALRNGRLIHQLHVEARHDELTGLPNRLALRELLDAVAERSSAQGPSCAVMVLDLNGFKTINDTLGHQAGDELLQVLAGRLATAVAERATVARLGGDEFSVLSTICGDQVSARELASGLLEAFKEPVLVSGARLRVGGSIGIALGPQHGSTGSDLLRHADIAMYAAKADGGGYRLFAPDLVELTASGLTLATDLRDAIEHGEISVVAQPMVDLITGALHSVEVLARWHHPELGEVPPEQFFAAAERSGQVQALSAGVLDLALRLSRRGLDAGLRLRVAVNLAGRWLTEPTLPEQVGTALARHGVAADMLCLELTERSIIADPRHANETLARLRAMGVHLSVDDFGTGYSSLTYLSRLPVDQMKIDKSFVAELDGNERDRAIVRSMIDLGRNLGLEVVAEGVSTAAARQVLSDLGCRLGQGYLIARPVDPERLLAGLAASASPGGSSSVPAPREQVRGTPTC